MADKTATPKLPDGKTLEFPVLSGTTGPNVVDIRTLYGKLDVHTRSAAVGKALRGGLIA